MFGRKGNSYLALYTSGKNIVWQTTGDRANQEIISDGDQGVWICICGSSMNDGTFQQFTQTILNSTVNVNITASSTTEYHTYEYGKYLMQEPKSTEIKVLLRFSSSYYVTFGWNDPLLIYPAGSQSPISAPLAHTMRYDGPYMKSNFPARELTMKYGSSSLYLSYDDGKRVVVDGN